MLDVHDVSYAYHTLSGETKALNCLSFQVYFNEFLGIIGPSGSGKSTILSLIAGLIPPESGDIKIHESLCKKSHHAYRLHASEGPSAGMADHL